MRVNLCLLPLFTWLFVLCVGGIPARADTIPMREQGWGIHQLMQTLQQVKSASGQFVERKFLHVLDQPLVTSGTLLYVAPDQVQKVTVSPKWERLAISGDTLAIDGGSDERGRTLSLARNPELGAFVEGIRATLAGDLAALQRYYQVDLAGSAGDWQLRLVPLNPNVQKLVTSIRITGTGNTIRQVVTEEADGDHSEMSIVENTR